MKLRCAEAASSVAGDGSGRGDLPCCAVLCCGGSMSSEGLVRGWGVPRRAGVSRREFKGPCGSQRETFGSPKAEWWMGNCLAGVSVATLSACSNVQKMLTRITKLFHKFPPLSFSHTFPEKGDKAAVHSSSRHLYGSKLSSWPHKVVHPSQPLRPFHRFK